MTKHDALEQARKTLLVVLDAASFNFSGMSLDGHVKPGTWTIGPRADIPGGLLDEVRKAIAACDAGQCGVE